jgi:hypothetical protein
LSSASLDAVSHELGCDVLMIQDILRRVYTDRVSQAGVDGINGVFAGEGEIFVAAPVECRHLSECKLLSHPDGSLAIRLNHLTYADSLPLGEYDYA